MLLSGARTIDSQRIGPGVRHTEFAGESHPLPVSARIIEKTEFSGPDVVGAGFSICCIHRWAG